LGLKYVNGRPNYLQCCIFRETEFGFSSYPGTWALYLCCNSGSGIIDISMKKAVVYEEYRVQI
jgi:hypothetical protein